VISGRGETVIPKEFREHFDAHDGDQLEWSVNEKEDIMDLLGSLPVHKKMKF
jgi:bifunctional DNA-binding transcriptional regulator/antitoxin component of YhaV-PrlF toxin-antitoxin module